MMMTAREETLSIPPFVRKLVDRRDRGWCRMCGKYVGNRRAIHHIEFGGDKVGMGGRRKHDLKKLISLCWQPGDNDCHQRAHAEKDKWQRLLLQALKTPNRVTAFQLLRRERAAEARDNE